MKKTKDYYRKITERFPQALKKGVKKNLKAGAIVPHLNNYLTAFFGLLSISLLLIFGLYLLKYFEAQEARSRAADTLSYWEDVIRTHPNFPDGYYNAGYYSSIMGENQKAVDLLEKAIALDPSFDKAKSLEKAIVSRN